MSLTRRQLLLGGSAAIAAGLWSVPVVAEPAARALYIQRQDTGERTFAYFTRDGLTVDVAGYDTLCVALRDAHVNWTRGVVQMAPALLELLYEVQQTVWAQFGVRAPISMHSGYRSFKTNASTEGAVFHSWHCAGSACDFHMPGIPLAAIRDIAEPLRLRGGLGYYPRGGANSDEGWVHLDVADRRSWVG